MSKKEVLQVTYNKYKEGKINETEYCTSLVVEPGGLVYYYICPESMTLTIFNIQNIMTVQNVTSEVVIHLHLLFSHREICHQYKLTPDLGYSVLTLPDGTMYNEAYLL